MRVRMWVCVSVGISGHELQLFGASKVCAGKEGNGGGGGGGAFKKGGEIKHKGDLF